MFVRPGKALATLVRSLSIDGFWTLVCRINGVQLSVKCCTRIVWIVLKRSFVMKGSVDSTVVLALN